MNKKHATLLGAGFVAFSFIPVWRSGSESYLNLWELILKHTVWGDKIKGRWKEGVPPYWPEETLVYGSGNLVPETPVAGF